MIGYNKAHGTYNGYKVVCGTTCKDIDKIMGLRNTIIYVHYRSYLNMSYEFERQCRARNIEVRMLS